jgi:hypothetical protein
MGTAGQCSRKFGDGPINVAPKKNKLQRLPTLLEQLCWCSVYGPVQEYWIKKSENMLVWLSKLVVAQHPICTLSFSLMSGIGKT